MVEVSTIGTLNGSQLSLNGKQFGDPYVIGLQHKGRVIVDGKDQFLKLDDLNPTVKGKWEESFDYQYSSVSESIVSSFMRNCLNTMDYVDYKFVKTNESTGTLSNNFLRDDEVERIVSHHGAKSVDDGWCMTIDEYASTIVDTTTDKRLTNLANVLKKYGVENPESFLVQQAGFDILFGNADRLHNPSNFVMAYNTKTKTSRLINMDYGRCLQGLVWTHTTESKYDLQEFLEEDVSDYKDVLNRKSNGLLSHTSKQQSINTLKEFGFEPFEVDLEKLFIDLNKLKEDFKGTACEKYALVKIETFKEMIQNETQLIKPVKINHIDVTLEDEQSIHLEYTTGEGSDTHLKFIFNVSNTPVLSMFIDTDKQYAKTLHVSDKIAADAIVPPNKRDYAGVETIIQRALNEKDPLKDLISYIKDFGLHIPQQKNVTLTIEDGFQL